MSLRLLDVARNTVSQFKLHITSRDRGVHSEQTLSDTREKISVALLIEESTSNNAVYHSIAIYLTQNVLYYVMIENCAYLSSKVIAIETKTDILRNWFNLKGNANVFSLSSPPSPPPRNDFFNISETIKASNFKI